MDYSAPIEFLNVFFNEIKIFVDDNEITYSTDYENSFVPAIPWLEYCGWQFFRVFYDIVLRTKMP